MKHKKIYNDAALTTADFDMDLRIIGDSVLEYKIIDLIALNNKRVNTNIKYL